MSEAQQLHHHLGVAIADAKQAHGNKMPSPTKSGPGRYTVQGKEAREPRKPKAAGAGIGFAAHSASKAKKERRRFVKMLGRRQALKLLKTERMLARPWFHDIPADAEAPFEV